MTVAYKAGSIVQNADTDLIWLKSFATQDKYDTFESIAGVNYQVPADHEFIITKIISFNTAASQAIRVGYADDALDNAVGPPTNGLYGTDGLKGEGANIGYERDVFIRVPATKYPLQAPQGGNSGTCIIGYERSTA